MAPLSAPESDSGIRDNHTRGSVGNFLQEKIQSGSKLSIVSACFTIYAFQALQGYRVVVARNVVEALEHARNESSALILMDIPMPGVDGLDATRCLRTDTLLAAILLIALTTLAIPGDRARCLAAGTDDDRAKPVSLRGIAATIATYLRPVEQAETSCA